MGDKGKRTLSSATVSLIVLVAVTFFTALYMKGLNSGIPLYYDSIGYSATIGGTFVAVFTLASTVMRLVGGQVTDHFPHYKVLLGSLAGLGLGVAIPALWDNFYVVMGARVLQGASFALATNVMTVAVMGSASKKHLGRRVGIKGAGTSLGTMLGALVATWLLDSAGYQGFYLFYAGLMVVAIAAVVILHRSEAARAKRLGAADEADRKSVAGAEEEGAHGAAAAEATTSSHDGATGTAAAPMASAAARSRTTRPAKPSFKQRVHAFIAPYLFPQVAPYLAISFARRVPKGLCISFVLVFAKHAGIAMGAAFFIAAGATTLVCRLCGGKLFDSNKTWLLWPLLSVQIIGFAILAIAPSFATLLVAAVGYGISVGTSSPFVKTITAKATPKEHWGVVNGEVYFFGDMGKATGAFVGGLIIDATAKTLLPEIALGFALFTSAVTGIALLVGHHLQAKKTA
ncbi:MFS transporter [uncultured Adlercreutzia sp.]|uniref:MFS transporter n=1 Tax=uncultured Adlercreutzia sp. TaxID=875803 RepID=UPI0025CBEBF9|nr:MFS transporter [uncultured Adlercreutzia sp.]MCI9260880.1 MFS transporter [Eggerthellaceae bacterium]